MLSLIVVLAAGQAGFSPPPLVPAEERFPISAPPLLDAPTAREAEQARELTELRHSNERLQSQFQLQLQLSELDARIASFDTSGPGWAKALRIVGYLLVVPAFVFMAPVVSGSSLAVGAAGVVSSSTTLATLTPTYNTIGLVLTVVAGMALALGITFGVVGWIVKTLELDGLVQQRAELISSAEIASRLPPSRTPGG